ncbi:hypothetical protein [Gandjariella thermophila]|uniref:HEAT repeat domain-containing protein n=1 Tax=Gandjariella thermophila TaxID=1931992 RepID=A0A4D4J9U7_9PSEU|nr:hypothetical protein [Gandjariella thermophila]GDY33441.1 hypothetical protein GTS_50740 [Gandjariella thermophila]
MQYVEPGPVGRDALAAALGGGDGRAIAEALVGVAYHDPDWQWVQDTCLRLLGHPDTGVRAIAITCLGHVARVHRQLDTDKVVPALTRLTSDPDLGGRAEDALDDINHFLGAN